MVVGIFPFQLEDTSKKLVTRFEINAVETAQGWKEFVAAPDAMLHWKS
jgi:hypothetical protein